MEGIEVNERSNAKYLKVAVHPDGRVVVTKPVRLSLRELERWLAGKQEWIDSMREKFAKDREKFERVHGKPLALPKLRRGTAAYKEAVERARTIATERVRHFAQLGAFSHGTISIRNQKTRWGSCSARGNLSFNYRLAHLPPELVDYLIVHELAHTKHHNHSAKFWEEVSRFIPEAKAKRNELHRYRF